MNYVRSLIAMRPDCRFGPAEQVSVVLQGADKSLARPGGKQARATEDFDVHISYLLS
jgi:hypothetical protein